MIAADRQTHTHTHTHTHAYHNTPHSPIEGGVIISHTVVLAIVFTVYATLKMSLMMMMITW